mmetsp:Transcript_45387/g.94481  ORF Transcript_45387/g.94481 Transcript_45387/m.94481 type:complete len:92 (+) Transcript_45387:60-335(+)
MGAWASGTYGEARQIFAHPGDAVEVRVLPHWRAPPTQQQLCAARDDAYSEDLGGFLWPEEHLQIDARRPVKPGELEACGRAGRVAGGRFSR